MANNFEIVVKKAILHILDSNGTLPVFSQEELDLSEDAIYTFISTHVRKMYEDTAARNGEFTEQSPILEVVKNIDDSFMDCSITISNSLYKLMKTHVDIPSADLLLAIVEISAVPYLAIIKFNYKEGYTHSVDYNESGTKNKIIVHKVIFPSESQKIDEGALINLKNYSVKTVEKEYFIDGEKKPYFSEMFLKCKTNLSQKESIKVINDVAKEIAKKYYNDDFEKSTVVKSAIYNNLEDEGNVDISVIAEKTFPDSPQIKKEYIEKIKQAGVDDKIEFTGENPEKSFSKYKIKMDNGIELNIPMDVYKNKDIIEFINNANGTVSIVIKQVSKIINR